jgi:hypothetical protein
VLLPVERVGLVWSRQWRVERVASELSESNVLSVSSESKVLSVSSELKVLSELRESKFK